MLTVFMHAITKKKCPALQIGFRLRADNLTVKREWIEALRRGKIIQTMIHEAEAKQHAGGQDTHAQAQDAAYADSDNAARPLIEH
jgi:hypothetical protein